MSMKLTTHLHLLSRLRMSGTLSLLPMYGFMVWTRKALPFYITVSCLALQLSCCLYCSMLQNSKNYVKFIKFTKSLKCL